MFKNNIHEKYTHTHTRTHARTHAHAHTRCILYSSLFIDTNRKRIILHEEKYVKKLFIYNSSQTFEKYLKFKILKIKN